MIRDQIGPTLSELAISVSPDSATEPCQQPVMAWLRDIDHWFIRQVLPHRSEYQRLARRLVGPENAEDIVQEAYCRLIGYPRWREIEDARAMCLRTIRNLAIDRLRSADIVHIDRLAEIEAVDPADDRPDQFRIISGRIDLERLSALIDKLPPQCGRVLRLRKIDGNTPGEIADLLDISVSTVEKHLAKGMALVTAGLREEKRIETFPARAWLRRRTQK